MKMVRSHRFWHFWLPFQHSFERSSNSPNFLFLPSKISVRCSWFEYCWRLQSFLRQITTVASRVCWRGCLNLNLVFMVSAQPLARCCWVKSVMLWFAYELLLWQWNILSGSSCYKFKDIMLWGVMACHHVMSVRFLVIINSCRWEVTVIGNINFTSLIYLILFNIRI